MESTPGREGTGRSLPPAPHEETNFREDEDRIRSLLPMCFDDGVYPTEIDPGEMVVDGREVRFKLNTLLDEIKVKWLKERTVTVIYKDPARFLPKNIKDDLVRAFEDEWVIGNESLRSIQRHGRIKIERPGVTSYVARTREVAEYMVREGQVEVTLGDTTYKVIFKPWMTRAEFRELRRQDDESTFWVIALQIPLDDMPFIYAQIEKAIGKIIQAHPTDADPDRPALVNARFDIDPEARANMKDIIWVATSKGDVLEIRLGTTGTLKCSKCKQFFHSEQDCQRGARGRNQGTSAGATGQNQPQQTGEASLANGATQGQHYQGPLRSRPQTPRQPEAASHAANVKNNPTFSPQGEGGRGGGVSHWIPSGGHPLNPYIPYQNLGYGMVQQGWQVTGMPQGGSTPMDWLMANGVSPVSWAGWNGTQGGQGGTGQAGQGYQPIMGEVSSTSGQVAAGAQRVGHGMSTSRLFGGMMGGDARAGGRGDQRSESTPGRARTRGAGKQRRLSMTSQQDLVSEPSGDSIISKEDSEKSVNNEGRLVTPRKKTTRDRRLTTTIKSFGTDMTQYLVSDLTILPGVIPAASAGLAYRIAEKSVDPRDIVDGITLEEHVAIREEEAQMVATVFSWRSDNSFISSPPPQDSKADAGFKIVLEKSEFFLSEISFLAYVVTRGGSRLDSRKVEAVREATTRTSLTQVRAFLGLASYYRRFIKGFAAIARPLTNLLRKDQPLNWDAECERAFCALKEALASAPILIRPDPERQFLLITNWQPEAISAILAQKGKDGREHVVEYASKTVPDERKNDSAPQGECYAVVWGIQHFHSYLYGQKFLLITDHEPLLALKKLTNYTGMIGRWAVRLQEYDFDIVHRKTERHENADGLTRLHRPGKVPRNEEITLWKDPEQPKGPGYGHVKVLPRQVKK
ncbi:hypothetical protein CBR_g32581 [Chara braunii]|uniref:Reverse transcriptase/retrotransposon-derived protein RNase H-like domain-containing protein n=1 Tax=Chara braunii TaxID=69332 RepID=A0A388LGZ2_CHABU|nr:hypothetical protein CBR_g32581 [Chara braunii]|eukprot:GBG81589.1 hypothetical protein CBR_g32581 [Chara braunii]